MALEFAGKNVLIVDGKFTRLFFSHSTANIRHDRLYRTRHNVKGDHPNGKRRRREESHRSELRSTHKVSQNFSLLPLPPTAHLLNYPIPSYHRYSNVYGIDMPTRDELVAHGRTLEEVRQIIGCDALIYQSVEDMKRAVGSINPALDGFEASCFHGVYVTGDISADDVNRLHAQRSGSEEDEADSSRLSLPNSREQ